MSMVLSFALFVGMCCAVLGLWSGSRMAPLRSASQ
jgi:hypothetical protein